MRIKIKTKDVVREIELYTQLAPQTVRAIVEALPIRGCANRWGDEIYFETNLIIEIEENSKEIVELGDVAYWIPGRAICIFFGPTPISEGNEIKPASRVNVFGRIIGDLSIFRDVRDGDKVILER